MAVVAAAVLALMLLLPATCAQQGANIVIDYECPSDPSQVVHLSSGADLGDYNVEGTTYLLEAGNYTLTPGAATFQPLAPLCYIGRGSGEVIVKVTASAPNFPLFLSQAPLAFKGLTLDGQGSQGVATYAAVFVDPASLYAEDVVMQNFNSSLSPLVASDSETSLKNVNFLANTGATAVAGGIFCFPFGNGAPRLTLDTVSG
jgi:hypothetical protein